MLEVAKQQVCMSVSCMLHTFRDHYTSNIIVACSTATIMYMPNLKIANIYTSILLWDINAVQTKEGLHFKCTTCMYNYVGVYWELYNSVLYTYITAYINMDVPFFFSFTCVHGLSTEPLPLSSDPVEKPVSM